MSKATPLPMNIWRDPLMWLACGFGTGAARVAPGTFGTLVGLPFYYFMQALSSWMYLAIVAVFFIIGIATRFNPCLYMNIRLSAISISEFIKRICACFNLVSFI